MKNKPMTHSSAMIELLDTMRQLHQSKAELDAAKAMLKLPEDYCMVCGGTGWHYEGCKGVSGLIALSSLLAAKQGELDKAKANEARLEAALNTLAEFEYKGADWRRRKQTALSELLGPVEEGLQAAKYTLEDCRGFVRNPSPNKPKWTYLEACEAVDKAIARLRAAMGQKI